MSGFAFQPVQMPDFGATLARGQAYGANQLLALQQMRQMDTQDQRQNALAQFAPLMADTDPQRRMAALAGLARVMPEVALPMMQTLRDQMEWNGGGGEAAAPSQAAPVAAPAGDTSLPRGIRNNNFLNIEAGPFTQGLPGFQGSDGRFARFDTPEAGLAAADRLLASYGQRGLNTPLAIVSRWAPAGDGNNNPQAYAGTVARLMGVQPDTQLNMADPAVRQKLALAMAQVENGRPVSGDVTLAAGNSGAGGANSNMALPVIEGFDMAKVRRALQMPNNRSAQEYLKSYYAALQGIPRETMPRSPERLAQDLQLADRQATRVNTTVNNAGDRETDKLVAEQWNGLEQAVAQSGRTNILLDRASRALENFQPGVFAEQRLWLGQVAREFGLRSNASEGEVLRSVQRQLELAATPKGQGQITENERTLIREQIPILTSTPQGARATMQLLRQLNDYDAKIASIYRANARENGGRPNPVTVREQIQAFVQATPPPDATAALSPYLSPEQVGANRETPGPGGIGTASPPPNIPPPPGGGRIIMPGTR